MRNSDYRDYFDILGVDRSSSSNEIKVSFRKLARKYHPDVNPGDKKAEARFKEISEAYEVLSDPERRRKYEQFGRYWSQNGGGGLEADFGSYGSFDEFINDLLGRFVGNTSSNYSSNNSRFSNYSSRPIRNLDADISLNISFSEAFYGTERTLSVNNEKVQIKIPRGVKSGIKLRIKDKGNIQPGTGKRGDLYVGLNVQDHAIWYLEGDDLCAELPVSFDEIVLGAIVSVITPDGEVNVTIPPSTLPGKALRLKEKGWPIKNRRSDLLLILKMQVPNQWTSQELNILKELRNLRVNDPRKNWLKSARL